MIQQTQITEHLKRLSDSKLELADRGQDVSGREVRDMAGERIGKVEDLFIDESERRVRFLEVGSGGFMGIAQTKLLIPVESVQALDEETVRIGHGKRQLLGAPTYNPRLVDTEFLRRTYAHYGYAAYWTPEYEYPERWHL